VPVARHQPDLFSHNPRQAKLMPLIDRINHRYGRNMLGFGKTETKVRAFTGHAAFQRVPEMFEL
jgi:hypothetical protein